jgi:hypothetical protein
MGEERSCVGGEGDWRGGCERDGEGAAGNPAKRTVRARSRSILVTREAVTMTCFFQSSRSVDLTFPARCKLLVLVHIFGSDI